MDVGNLTGPGPKGTDGFGRATAAVMKERTAMRRSDFCMMHSKRRTGNANVSKKGRIKILAEATTTASHSYANCAYRSR